LLAGESIVRSGKTYTAPSFNPRPPLLAGESLNDIAETLIWVVSIRARHCWRANPLSIGHAGLVHMFQSAPAIAGGRILSR